MSNSAGPEFFKLVIFTYICIVSVTAGSDGRQNKLIFFNGNNNLKHIQMLLLVYNYIYCIYYYTDT